MARNATESDFRTFKMATGSHFVKKFTKIKIVVLIWNGKKCDTKWFLDIQNGYRRPFFKTTFTKKVARVIWTMFEPTAGGLQLDINSLLVNIYIYIQTAMLGTREYTLCSPFRANAHNSSYAYFRAVTQTPLSIVWWPLPLIEYELFKIVRYGFIPELFITLRVHGNVRKALYM